MPKGVRSSLLSVLWALRKGCSCPVPTAWWPSRAQKFPAALIPSQPLPSHHSTPVWSQPTFLLLPSYTQSSCKCLKVNQRLLGPAETSPYCRGDAGRGPPVIWGQVQPVQAQCQVVGVSSPQGSHRTALTSLFHRWEHWGPQSKQLTKATEPQAGAGLRRHLSLIPWDTL